MVLTFFPNITYVEGYDRGFETIDEVANALK